MLEDTNSLDGAQLINWAIKDWIENVHFYNVYPLEPRVP